MITVKSGDLLQSKAQTLVNTVNCVGVMGKGIALEFKRSFPEMYKDYVLRCDRHEVRLGEPYLFRQLLGPWVLNFPTKDHWRSLAKLDDIIVGLQYLERHYLEWGVTSLAVPPLGCGNGQLEWRVVGPTLYRYLSRLAIPVELYAPSGTPLEEMQSSFLDMAQPSSLSTIPLREDDSSWVAPSWIGLVEIVKQLSDQPFHWPIGRTIFQKIAYVATELGLPTGLDFEKASYGPFAHGLKKLEARLQNHNLIEERRIGNGYQITAGSSYDDARIAYSAHLEKWQPILDRTVDLFMRISTANQAELVATVMYSANDLATSDTNPSESEVFDAVQHWKRNRKPAIAEEDISEAIVGLAAQGWIKLRVEASDSYASIT